MTDASPPARRPERRRDDAGLSMVVTAASLLVVALLVIFSVKATLGSTSASSAGSSVRAPLAAADATQVQQTLSTGLAAAASAAGSTGSYVGLDASLLEASEPTITFVDGPSTGPNSVSVASTSDGSGSVTLAARTSNGTCWFAWRSPQAGTWYGAQTGTTTCAAQPVESTPDPAPVSNTSIGWQQGSFPQA
jgi:Flp pilus assembly protein TadG